MGGRRSIRMVLLNYKLIFNETTVQHLWKYPLNHRLIRNEDIDVGIKYCISQSKSATPTFGGWSLSSRPRVCRTDPYLDDLLPARVLSQPTVVVVPRTYLFNHFRLVERKCRR